MTLYLSPESVSTIPILFTTMMPPLTRPNMVCLPATRSRKICFTKVTKISWMLIQWNLRKERLSSSWRSVLSREAVLFSESFIPLYSAWGSLPYHTAVEPTLWEEDSLSRRDSSSCPKIIISHRPPREEDNLSIVDKMAGLKVLFIQRLHCVLYQRLKPHK